jgi:hypothetical protein
MNLIIFKYNDYDSYEYHDNGNIKSIKKYYLNDMGNYSYKYKEFYEDGQLFIDTFYNDKVIEGVYKLFAKTSNLITHKYHFPIQPYLNSNLFSRGNRINLNFKIIFCLLRIRDKMKSKIRRKRYQLLDNYILLPLTDIIMSYNYKIYNVSRNKCLI